MRPLNANMNGSWCPSSTTLSHLQQQMQHPLKINKESHIIKKPSSTTSSSSSSPLGRATPSPPPPPPPPKPQQRHPVIIYTHSPKIIHTHPKDFMALVQKLTGLNHANQEGDQHGANANNKKKTDININININNNNNNNNGNFMSRNRNHYHNHQGESHPDSIKVMGSNHEDNESLSGITTNEDMYSNVGDNGQVNSNCLGPPPMVFHHDHHSPNPFMGNVALPLYTGGSNNSNNNTNNNNNNCNELLCCTSSDPTYDFIDFNMPFHN